MPDTDERQYASPNLHARYVPQERPAPAGKSQDFEYIVMDLSFFLSVMHLTFFTAFITTILTKIHIKKNY